MNRGRGTQFALLLGVIFIGTMAWAGWDTMKRSGGMTPKGESGAALAASAPGASVRLLMEVLSVGDAGRFSGRLLEDDGGSYRPTAATVTARLTADSAIVMGAAADIKPSAVLELSGRVDDRHRVRVTRVVVLTGNVTVGR
jgi:hypothetical protein